jgi:cation-transporting P-type ATPase 13A2
MRTCKANHRDIAMFPFQTLNYPYPISTVFPASAEVTNDEPSARDRLALSLPKSNSYATLDTGVLNTLRFVDYRYSRFALDPRTGLFSVIRSAVH